MPRKNIQDFIQDVIKSGNYHDGFYYNVSYDQYTKKFDLYVFYITPYTEEQDIERNLKKYTDNITLDYYDEYDNKKLFDYCKVKFLYDPNVNKFVHPALGTIKSEYFDDFIIKDVDPITKRRVDYKIVDHMLDYQFCLRLDNERHMRLVDYANERDFTNGGAKEFATFQYTIINSFFKLAIIAHRRYTTGRGIYDLGVLQPESVFIDTLDGSITGFGVMKNSRIQLGHIIDNLINKLLKPMLDNCMKQIQMYGFDKREQPWVEYFPLFVSHVNSEKITLPIPIDIIDCIEEKFEMNKWPIVSKMVNTLLNR